MYNSIAELRRVLRSYTQLRASTSEVDSAIMFFDLEDALESGVMTPRQKEAVQTLLIQGLPASAVARQMGIKQRAVYTTVNSGLKRLHSFLHSGIRPKQNKNVAWTKVEVDYLIAHSGDSRVLLGKKFGRSTSAIYQKLSELRGNGLLIARKRPGRPLSRNDGGKRKAARVPDNDGSAV